MTSCAVRQTTVAIVGGGPAGSATAIALRRAGVRDILLFHAGGGTVVDCPAIGETIPPAATPLLCRLGVMNGTCLPGHLPSQGSQSVWGSGEVGFNDFLFDPAGSGYHLDRVHFDSQLRAAAKSAGVRLISGARFRAIESGTDGVRLQFSLATGHSLTCEAAFVVDATGLRATVVRKIGIARNVFDNLISLCALVDTDSVPALGDHTLIEATELGWWYGARLPRRRLILSFTSDQETLRTHGLYDFPTWRTAFGNTRFMRAKISPCLLTSVPLRVTKAAPTAILSAVVGKHWLAVGDAASTYDPISSAGITKALENGLTAGNAIAAYLRHQDDRLLQRYQSQVFADFTTHVHLRYQLYATETRWPFAPFWVHRQGLRRGSLSLDGSIAQTG